MRRLRILVPPLGLLRSPVALARCTLNGESRGILAMSSRRLTFRQRLDGVATAPGSASLRMSGVDQ